MSDKTFYISINSTDEEVSAFAAHLGACSEEVMEYVKSVDMRSLEFAKALGRLLAEAKHFGEMLPARNDFIRQQRAEVRDWSEQRRRIAQLARRDEPSCG